LAAQLRAACPRLPEDELAQLQRPRILMVGCGTGRHAAITAMLNPNARVLATDLSRASLAYGMHQARKLRLGKLAFAQADLPRPGKPGGVLRRDRGGRRAPSPGEAPRRLAGMLGRLAPRGFMKVALYSEAGRAAVVAARSLIAERGFAPDACPAGRQAAGIRACRQEILALPDDHPAKAVARSLDFYTLSGCRDLLFHVQEHRFTLPQIAAMLDALGLEFPGFELDAPGIAARYRAEFPGDPVLQSLENWAAFEKRHPTTFTHMYQFWVRRAGG
jgi:SAM-dependent methyltransferase